MLSTFEIPLGVGDPLAAPELDPHAVMTSSAATATILGSLFNGGLL
jgi:hypothetical protein